MQASLVHTGLTNYTLNKVKQASLQSDKSKSEDFKYWEHCIYINHELFPLDWILAQAM